MAIMQSEAKLHGTAEHVRTEWRVARVSRHRRRLAAASLLGMIAVAVGGTVLLDRGGSRQAGPASLPPALVTVSPPLRRVISDHTSFLGQFSAVDQVELRAQVGGTLTAIGFKDGQIVHKGDLLFVIDPRPYQIRLAQAEASVATAAARLALATAELWRAQQLKRGEFGTAETVDQRVDDQRAAGAALATAKQSVADAQLDLGYCHVTAPFTGRISNHRVSVGSLVSGSRAGTSPTTLLTTLVSLDPIHLDFDMSENDFVAYERARSSGKVGRTVNFRLSDEDRATRHGTLDFIDNVVDAGSGTIHARATVANKDLFLVPGEFARLSLVTSAPHDVLLVPDKAVMLDQSQSLVLTVSAQGTVVPKLVTTGPLALGLREILSGLSPDDRVIIDGLMHARPGTKVAPQAGTIVAATAS